MMGSVQRFCQRWRAASWAGVSAGRSPPTARAARGRGCGSARARCGVRRHARRSCAVARERGAAPCARDSLRRCASSSPAAPASSAPTSSTRLLAEARGARARLARRRRCTPTGRRTTSTRRRAPARRRPRPAALGARARRRRGGRPPGRRRRHRPVDVRDRALRLGQHLGYGGAARGDRRAPRPRPAARGGVVACRSTARAIPRPGTAHGSRPACAPRRSSPAPLGLLDEAGGRWRPRRPPRQAAPPDLGLRHHEARPRGALPQRRRRVRHPDRGAPLLQRVRAAPGALEPVHRRRRDLLVAAAERPRAADLRGRQQSRDFVHVATSSRRTCSRWAEDAAAARDQRRHRRRDLGAHRRDAAWPAASAWSRRPSCRASTAPATSAPATPTPSSARALGLRAASRSSAGWPTCSAGSTAARPTTASTRHAPPSPTAASPR